MVHFLSELLDCRARRRANPLLRVALYHTLFLRERQVIYFLEGTVVSGYQVGRKIGFPTANLRVDFPNKLIPSIGVYAVRVQVAGQQWKGMLSIGYRPTINNGNDLSIEVHILDFQGDIYNQKMRLEFIEFLRPEIKFDSIDELIAQMHKDKEETIKVLS